MKVLLSIKPQYSKKIFEGKKKYEYRKSIFKNENIDTIVVYETMPTGKVVGEFKIDKIIKDDPLRLWNQTKKNAGILKKDYMDYFKDRKYAFAIVIKNIKLYDTPLELVQLDPEIKKPPQSFRYIFDKESEVSSE